MAKAGRKAGLRASVDSSKMQFDPLVMERTDIPLWREYDDLRPIVQEYMAGHTNDKWRIRAINYMVWLYSEDTILNTKPVEPLVDRKYKALDLAGFKMDQRTNDYSDRIKEELFDLLDEPFVDMVLRYLIFQKNDLWTEIVVTSEQHHEVTRLRLQPVSGKDSKQTMEAADTKKKLRLESKELLMDIKQYWDEFWEDHMDLKTKGQEKLYRSIEDRARINVGT
jgi:hypothetical protein